MADEILKNNNGTQLPQENQVTPAVYTDRRPPIRPPKKPRNPWKEGVVRLVSRLVALPIFIIAHKNFPNPEWPVHLDRILLFIIVILATELVVRTMKQIVFMGFVIMMGYLTYGSIAGKYGWLQLSTDYQVMLQTMFKSPHPEQIFISKLGQIPNKSKINEAIDYGNPVVRDFAIVAISEHFKDVRVDKVYRTTVHSFAVFKAVNQNWNYVSDPKYREYFAKASESVRYLSGDCDDYSILMAAAIKAVGGTTRLIYTTGHIYPELYIGDKADLEKVNYMVKKQLFVEESRGLALHYHIDEAGQVWLNLDYTEKYPGGRFLDEEILGAFTPD